MGSPNVVTQPKACIGYFWKAKTRHKKSRGNRTSGNTKSFACQASSIERYMATKGRSYKHPRYGMWCEVKNGKIITRRLS